MQGSVAALTIALDVRDRYTRTHCDRVVTLAVELGKACRLSSEELDHLRTGARFHDIGKIGIPDSVLLNPGRLSAVEWEVMKTHSEYGERIFRATAVRKLEPIAKAIRHHHESFDGSGYPDGLAGEEIPLLGRLLLIVDAYDAMTSDRPYHRARSHGQAMEVLDSESGSKLDPGLLREFRACVERSPARAS